jgi:hypothetical protein
LSLQDTVVASIFVAQQQVLGLSLLEVVVFTISPLVRFKQEHTYSSHKRYVVAAPSADLWVKNNRNILC